MVKNSGHIYHTGNENVFNTFNELDALMCDDATLLLNIIDMGLGKHSKSDKERYARVFRMACTRKDFIEWFNSMPEALYIHWMKYYKRLANDAGVKYVADDILKSIRVKRLKTYGILLC